jgi:16S rRNA processing protein RimM
MIDLSNCFELGTIIKCHGVHGDVVLRLNNLSFDNIKEMELVFIEIDGLPVPFFISEYAERSKDTLVLNINNIDKEEDAKDIINCRVYVKSSLVELPEKLVSPSNHLIGYTVIDSQLGELGVIEEIFDFDNNVLLRISRAKKEVLIPFHEDLIHEIDAENKILRVKTPEGLIGLS